MTPSSGEDPPGEGASTACTTTTQQEEEIPAHNQRQGQDRRGWSKEDQEKEVLGDQQEACEQEGVAGGRQEWDTQEEGADTQQQGEGGGHQEEHTQTAATSSTQPPTSGTTHTESTATDTGTWPPSLRVRRTGEALDAFLQAANAHVSAETMRGVTPSFTDALEWVTTRSAELNSALRLVHLYPNLIQADCLDGLWDFLMPFVQKGTGLRVSTLEEDHLAMHGSPELSNTATRRGRRNTGRGHPVRIPVGRDYGTTGTRAKASSPKLVYVCCNKSNVSNNADVTGGSGGSFCSSAIDRLIMALSSQCFVQCSPLVMPPVAPTSQHGGWPHTVHHAHVMVLMMDTYTLNSEICMKEQEEALRHSTPVVMVRAKDYELPDTFPVGVQNIRIPRPDSGRKRAPTVTVSSIRSTLVPKTDDFRLPQLEVQSPTMDDNVKHLYSLSHAGITLRKSSTEEDCSEATLEDHIRKLMPKAVEYSVNSHDLCFDELRRRLKLYIGRGIFSGSTGSKSPDPQINVKETELLLNVGCIVPAKRQSGGSGSSLHVDGQWGHMERPRAYSIRSAPEYRKPTPLNSSLPQPKQLQNQDPKAQPQNAINGYTLLPPIDATASGPLRKHRSQELPPPSPRLELTTDRRTNYLLLRKPGSGAELVPWPPEERKDEEKGNSESLGEDGPFSGNESDELFGLRLDSDSDSSLTVALSSNDINLSSLSPTPDFV